MPIHRSTRAFAVTATVDRRAFRRLPALANRTFLEWCDGSGTRKVVARVINISPAGALVSADGPLSVGHSVWLRLEEPASTPWIGGRVVRVDGVGSIGIRFHEPCPRDFYEAAVQGIGFGNLLG